MSDDSEAGRKFAAQFNNAVWNLLGRADRSAADDERMVHAAHASHMHWLDAGDAANHQRGLWLIARVYAELGNAQEAARYADLCRGLTDRAADRLQPFDLVYCQEAEARAAAVSGNAADAQRLKEKALAAAADLADQQTRDMVVGDINAGNWGVLDGGA